MPASLTEQVDPALKGTQNVLSSVIKHKATVKRVVVTSSGAGKRSPLTQACTALKQHLYFSQSAGKSRRCAAMDHTHPALGLCWVHDDGTPGTGAMDKYCTCWARQSRFDLCVGHKSNADLTVLAIASPSQNYKAPPLSLDLDLKIFPIAVACCI